MVYAVATDTIQHFEAALGRRIHWRRAERDVRRGGRRPGATSTRSTSSARDGGGQRLLQPARRTASSSATSAPTRTDPGRNLPGQTVFTCLSHDIIVHETTHAIIDGIRGHFTEQTNPDVPAFHEAFADLAALFRHFSHKEVLLDTIQRTGGRLVPSTSLQAAARRGGRRRRAASIGAADRRAQSAGRARAAVRRGHRARTAACARRWGRRRTRDDIEKMSEPHLRGSILVAAVFDAYFSIYVRRTADLFRIYRAGGGSDRSDRPARRRCPAARREASRTAEQFFFTSACARSTIARRSTSPSATSCAR